MSAKQCRGAMVDLADATLWLNVFEVQPVDMRNSNITVWGDGGDLRDLIEEMSSEMLMKARVELDPLTLRNAKRSIPCSLSEKVSPATEL